MKMRLQWEAAQYRQVIHSEQTSSGEEEQGDGRSFNQSEYQIGLSRIKLFEITTAMNNGMGSIERKTVKHKNRITDEPNRIENEKQTNKNHPNM